MVCFILNRCNSDRVVSCVCSIYSYCFTSCVFYVVTGYVYFVSCTSFTELIACFRGYFSDIFVTRTSYVFFSLYFFSRSCSRFYVVNIYSIYSFCAAICILNYIASYLRSIFTFYSTVLFNLFLALSDKSATTLLPDAVVLMYSPLLAPTTPKLKPPCLFNF